MNTKPLVSIITPSLNHDLYIEESISSVMNQDYPRIEHIIIDGGSTDNTLTILKNYSHCLSWISESDNGLYDAVNKGWLRSTGKYIGYLNSDDALCFDAISVMVEYLESHTEVALVYGDCHRLNKYGELIETLKAGDSPLHSLLKNGNTIFTGAMLLRRQVLEEIGLLDISYKYAADYDFCIRIAKKYPIGYINKTIAEFRIHTDSKSQNSKWQMWEEALAISYKYSGKRYLSLHSRYLFDRLIHILPQKILWSKKVVPIRKKIRNLWNIGN